MVIWRAGWLCEWMWLVRLDVCANCGQGPSMVFVHLWAASACGVPWLWALSVWPVCQCMVCWSVCMVCESGLYQCFLWVCVCDECTGGIRRL